MIYVEPKHDGRLSGRLFQCFHRALLAHAHIRHHTRTSNNSAAMPQIPLTTSITSNFQAVFYASLKAYEEKTKKDLLLHPLMPQLQTCNSPTDILTVLRNQVRHFEKSTRGDDKLTRWLNPTINVLYAFSSALGAGVGLVRFILTAPRSDL